ncbi:beta-propeller domain-containing protein [Nocardioides sp. Iso805N]|uniref:beta-propeller domain-containing protein n=1 Tax=Nocardioides sp. Iso805N TaxID=1283287 RepID=UPI00035F6D30|nr:beta-propeller domain-containing protein [Nocardioides sp. Iso805N]
MTDLEDLWASYPTSTPPIDALLAQGRREARLRRARREAQLRRRRRAVRPLLVAGVVVAVASAYVGTHDGLRGSGAGGSGHGATSAQDGAAGDAGLRASAFQADLHPATSCTTLLADYRRRAAEQVTAYGWAGQFSEGPILHGLAATTTAPLATRSAEAALGSSATGTNVQEAGVDEPDDVKTDGSLLVRINDARLTVYDVSGPEVGTVAHLTLPHLSGGEILLSGTTVVAIGNDTTREARGGTRVEAVSLSDPTHPIVTSDVRYSGASVSARQHGNVVRLVLADGVPDLPFVSPHGTLTAKRALARNRAIVAHTTLDDWLPRYDDGSGSRPLLDCGDVALPPSGLTLGTESVVGFDASTPMNLDAIGIAGVVDTAYESADRLYLASGGADGLRCDCLRPAGNGPATREPGDDTTTIFQFDLAGTAATHVATGKLKGSIAGRWSMDEADGILRVALTHGAGKKRASAVVTLHPVGRELVELARVDGLGLGETLTAARWFDDLAIVSTARRTDPVYTVDLADPSRPRLAGALHIPGYSTYFHPIGGGLLLGVGQTVAFAGGAEDERSQVGLFDISDASDVRQIRTARLPRWTWPTAGDDPRAFTWSPDLHTAFTTFSTARGGALLGVYHVSGDTMASRTIRLATADPASVRTIELPDRRVLLIVGSHVSFLDV